MDELLKNFFKEEWRLHTSLYNYKSFAAFPLVIIATSFLIALSLVYTNFYAFQNLSLAIHYLLLLYGFGVGAFGLHAKDFLERRFGQTGYLLNSFLTLPYSLKRVFFYFVLKDIIFYFAFVLAPLTIGVLLASPFIPITAGSVLLLFVSLILSFFLGLSFSFFLSLLYEKLRIPFYIVAFAIVSAFTYYYILLGTDILHLLPPYTYYLTGSLTPALISSGSILAFFFLGFLFLGREFRTKVRFKRRVFEKSLFHYNNGSPLVKKDITDLRRTGGLISKPLFSMVIPTYLFFLIFTFFSLQDVISFEAIILGYILGSLSTTIFNWLLESDSLRYYIFLPLTLKDYIHSKLKVYFSLTVVYSALILLFFTFFKGQTRYFFYGFFLTLLVSWYHTSLVFYLGGLNPQYYLYHYGRFIKYVLLTLPLIGFMLIIFGIFIANTPAFSFALLGLFLVLLLLSVYYLQKGIQKWQIVHYE